MDYVTSYYKDLCEQLQAKLNIVGNNLKQLNEIKQSRALRLAKVNPDDPRVLSAMGRQAYRLAKTGVAQDVETDNLVRGFGLQPSQAMYNTGYASSYVGSANFAPEIIDMPGARLPARSVGETEAQRETGNKNFSQMFNPEQQKAAPIAARKAAQLNTNIAALGRSRGIARGTINNPGLAPHFQSGKPVELEIDDYDIGDGEYRFDTRDTYGNRYTVVQGMEDGREYRTRNSITAYPTSYLSQRYLRKDGKNMVDPSRRDMRTYLQPEAGIEIVDADKDGDRDTLDAVAYHLRHAQLSQRRTN